jgi:hypothetical protein
MLYTRKFHTQPTGITEVTESVPPRQESVTWVIYLVDSETQEAVLSKGKVPELQTIKSSFRALSNSYNSICRLENYHRTTRNQCLFQYL